MTVSQNGWTVLTSRSQCRDWKIPVTKTKTITLPMVPGPAGFVLACWALYWHQNVEPIGAVADDWGWAYRDIRGSTEISNHASGTAADINATCHHLGDAPSASMSAKQIKVVHNGLAQRRFKVLRWGGDYLGRKDPMHSEINAGSKAVLAAARMARLTPLGRTIEKYNKYPLSEKVHG